MPSRVPEAMSGSRAPFAGGYAAGAVSACWNWSSIQPAMKNMKTAKPVDWWVPALAFICFLIGPLCFVRLVIFGEQRSGLRGFSGVQGGRPAGSRSGRIPGFITPRFR